MENDQFAIIADGTYIYCEKSSNNNFQKETYSLQKYRHSVKPFVTCSTNGYIIDIFGPYGARFNDAKILSSILKKHERFRNLLRPKDLVILDIGFRDCIQELKDKYDLIPKMPTCSKKHLTSLQAKIRWIVEALNGIYKKLFTAL